MVRKLAAGSVLGLIALLAAGGIASARVQITSPTEIATIETHKVQHTVDLGRPGLSVGDVFTVSTDLSSLDGGTTLGHLHEICTVIHPERSRFSLLCSGVTQFADGQVSATGWFPPTQPGIVTGGTGAYENVGGSVQITPTASGTLELDYHLVP